MQMGIDILESIQHSARTPCGYATIKDVRTHVVEDRMESFFLAETTKYLYLLFDPDNFLHANGSEGTIIQTSHGECIIDAGGYIFNTEAHPIDVAAVYCCGVGKEEDALLRHFHDSMDLIALLSSKTSDFLKPLHNAQKYQKWHLKEEPSPDPDFIAASLLPDVVVLNPPPSKLEYGTGIEPLTTNMRHGVPELVKSPTTNETERNDDANNSQAIPANETEKAHQNATSTHSLPGLPAQQSPVPEIPYYADMLEDGNLSLESNASTIIDFSNENNADEGLGGSAPLETNSAVKEHEPLGTGQVTYLGEISESEESHATSMPGEEECADADMSDDKSTVAGFSGTSEMHNHQRPLWSGTKPIMSSVQRDTLYSGGLSRVSGIGLMGLERNSSFRHAHGKLKVTYEMLSCPAQPFILRFAVLGEMFGVN